MGKFVDEVLLPKFADEPERIHFQNGTVGDLIDRFIGEMDGGVRPLGSTHRIVLRHLQRWPIAKVIATELKKSDLIEHCRERRKKVCAATANQDMTCLSGVLKYAGAAWPDCEDVADVAIVAAKPFLKKHDLIGKGEPRHQRPTAEQKHSLETIFEKSNRHKRTVTDMVRVSRWQHASSRRIGESCALLWRDWLPDDQTILVRKMKSKIRGRSKIVALPYDAQALLYEWAHEMNAKPELRDDEQRILPFNSHTCSQRYTNAKHIVGIHGDLHLHDDRRDRGSRLVEDEGYTAEEAIQFTGHDNTKVFVRTYMKLNPALVASGPASKREHRT